jgi:hypothetical protein
MQNQPATTPMSNFNALTNNPNGSDWMAKFNRPNVSNNYLGTTTRPMHRTRMMRGSRMMRTKCHYVRQNGMKTKVC